MLRKLVKARVKSGFYKPPAEARIDRPGYACMAKAGESQPNMSSVMHRWSPQGNGAIRER